MVLYVASSLDGYIAGPKGEIDWLFHDQDYGYNEFFATIDTVVMGRKTWELSRSFGPWPYGKAKSYVFSRTMYGESDERSIFVHEEIGPFIRQLKNQPGRDIWLVGGGQITLEVLKEDLVDEFVISIHPILLGGGIPMFPPGFPRIKLKFAGSQDYGSGLCQLTYERA